MAPGEISNSDPTFIELVGCLPEPHRLAVRLRHETGWKLASIARHLKRSPVEVAGLLLEAARIIQTQLDDSRQQEPR
jgi:DNA-directed RNA polymerase specialized sigma24 family protein